MVLAYWLQLWLELYHIKSTGKLQIIFKKGVPGTILCKPPASLSFPLFSPEVAIMLSKSFLLYNLFMAKIDKIKEQIGWLKVLFGLLFATDVSLIAYLFNKIDTLTFLKVCLVLISLVIVTIAIRVVSKRAMDKINELEDI